MAAVREHRRKKNAAVNAEPARGVSTTVYFPTVQNNEALCCKGRFNSEAED